MNKTLLLSFLISCFLFPLYAFEAININRSDIYVRNGFEPDWLLEKRYDEAWQKISGRENGGRTVQIRDLEKNGVSILRTLSLTSNMPGVYTMAVAFSLSPEQLPKRGVLGLELGTIGINWEIFLNGKSISREIYRSPEGKILLARSLTHLVIELDNRLLKEGKNTLHFKIIGDPANPETGFYIGTPFRIGPYSQLLSQTRKPFNLVLISFYLLVGLLFVSLYLKISHDRSHLYFGLFSIFFSGYKLMIHPIVQDLVFNTNITNRLEFLLCFSLIPVFLMYTDALLRQQISRFTRWYSGGCLLLMSFTFWAPFPLLFMLLRGFQLSVPMSFAYVLIMFRNDWKRSKMSFTFGKYLLQTHNGRLLLGIICCIGLSGFDVMQSVFFWGKNQFSQFGFAVIVCHMGISMIQRFSRMQNELLMTQKELAESRQQTIDTLEKTDRLKDEFLANTSHELRTPLHGIIGIAESISDLDQVKNAQEVKGGLQTVVSCAQRLNLLINDILDFSKLKHQELDLSLKPVDIGTISDVVGTLSGAKLRQKGLKLIRSFPSEIPMVLADENRLCQIIQNLLDNAVKFTPEGCITLGIEVEDRHLTFSVSDTGIGIEADQLKEIFEPFKQLDGSAAREQGGTGLGLSITQTLLKLHDSGLEVNSMPGKGTKFSFTLPVVTDDRSQALVETPLPTTAKPVFVEPLSAPDDGEFKVLAVDDDPVNLQIIQSILKPPVYSVQTTGSGAEALKIIDQNCPSVVLLDIMMPHLSGFDVCRMIRKQYGAEQLPVLFLTAKHQVQDLEKGFSLGANDYIMKPFARGELLTRVQYHLDFNRQIDVAEARLSALRQLAGDLKKFKKGDSLSKAIFQLLGDQIETDQILVYQNGQVTDQLQPEVVPNLPDLFLKNGSGESNTPAQEFLEGIGWAMNFQLDLPDSYSFVLIRNRSGKSFDRGEKSFINNLIKEISSVRGNIQQFIKDDETLRKYLELQSRLDDVYLIQADRQYCRIFFEDQRDFTDFDWSLGDIETYFDPSVLLRIHKSFIINPSKAIKAFKEKGSRDFSLIFNRPDIADIFKNLPGFKGIKLARSKEAHCKKQHPDWFK